MRRYIYVHVYVETWVIIKNKERNKTQKRKSVLSFECYMCFPTFESNLVIISRFRGGVSFYIAFKAGGLFLRDCGTLIDCVRLQQNTHSTTYRG